MLRTRAQRYIHMGESEGLHDYVITQGQAKVFATYIPSCRHLLKLQISKTYNGHTGTGKNNSRYLHVSCPQQLPGPLSINDIIFRFTIFNIMLTTPRTNKTNTINHCNMMFPLLRHHLLVFHQF